ncbi:MAG: DUF4440 domain-containing protein [Pleurocapsa sp. MO_226.B13]|nr:DUF4440 domain-containing protein [Pleurocapsa sp. MO_226.B13]
MLFTKAFKTFLAIALSVFLGFSSFFTQDAFSEAAPTAFAQSTFSTQTEKQEFRQLIERTHEAWNSHHPHELAKFYAKDADLIFYDALPMQYQGWDEYERGIQTNLFDKMPKFILSANDDLQLTRRDNLAWTTFTWHLSAELNNGTPIETDGRQTNIWEQRDGKWEIVHEHISAPVSL